MWMKPVCAARSISLSIMVYTGILAFGSNGEFYMFQPEEMERTLRIILDQTAHRVPVFFGMGMVSTKSCIALAKMAEQTGADGISVLQPMFLKPTEDELYAHFKAIANAVSNLPMPLQQPRPRGIHHVRQSGRAACPRGQ